MSQMVKNLIEIGVIAYQSFFWTLSKCGVTVLEKKLSSTVRKIQQILWQVDGCPKIRFSVTFFFQAFIHQIFFFQDFPVLQLNDFCLIQLNLSSNFFIKSVSNSVSYIYFNSQIGEETKKKNFGEFPRLFFSAFLLSTSKWKLWTIVPSVQWIIFNL